MTRKKKSLINRFGFLAAQLSMVSRLKNEYFLQLMGYYLDDSHRILVYQFASNGSLHDTLHGTASYPVRSCAAVITITITSRCCNCNLTKEEGKKNGLQARRA